MSYEWISPEGDWYDLTLKDGGTFGEASVQFILSGGKDAPNVKRTYIDIGGVTYYGGVSEASHDSKIYAAGMLIHEGVLTYRGDDDARAQVTINRSGDYSFVTGAELVDGRKVAARAGSIKITFKNTPPTVTLNTPQSQTLFENDNLSLDGTAQDADKGDVVFVKAKIADSRVINLSTKVSDGKPFDFTNTFLFKQGRLWQGNDPITSVLDGAGYKIGVWAEDDKGGKSKVETRSFSVVANRPPIVKVTKTPSFTNITNSTRLEVAGTITDPDGHDVTMTVKLNDAPQEEIAVNQGEWNYIFEAASLKEGANELTIVGRDEYGMSHTKTVRINNTIYKADMSHVPSVALFDIPLEGVESDGAVMWLRRKSDNTQFEARVATAGKKEEDFHEMQKTSHVVGNTPRDQFAGQTGVKTNNVTIEITSTGNHSLLMIQGVVK